MERPNKETYLGYEEENDLEGEFERSAGRIVVLSRFICDNNMDKIIGYVTTKEFFDFIDVKDVGTIDISQMSDYLVEAYDSGYGTHLDVENDEDEGATFAFQYQNGKVVRQHST